MVCRSQRCEPGGCRARPGSAGWWRSGPGHSQRWKQISHASGGLLPGRWLCYKADFVWIWSFQAAVKRSLSVSALKSVISPSGDWLSPELWCDHTSRGGIVQPCRLVTDGNDQSWQIKAAANTWPGGQLQKTSADTVCYRSKGIWVPKYCPSPAIGTEKLRVLKPLCSCRLSCETSEYTKHLPQPISSLRIISGWCLVVKDLAPWLKCPCVFSFSSCCRHLWSPAEVLSSSQVLQSVPVHTAWACDFWTWGEHRKAWCYKRLSFRACVSLHIWPMLASFSKVWLQAKRKKWRWLHRIAVFLSFPGPAEVSKIL